jgi:hypothetical protein
MMADTISMALSIEVTGSISLVTPPWGFERISAKTSAPLFSSDSWGQKEERDESRPRLFRVVVTGSTIGTGLAATKSERKRVVSKRITN